MGKAKTLTGKKFGKLTVIEDVGLEKVKCICECGNQIDVNRRYLLNGHRKSCDCMRGQNRTIDLTGKKFGRLTVIERAENLNGRVAWRCKCDCGNEKITTTQLLRRGTISSCGCLNSELSSERRFKDLSGQRFGKLTVIRQTGIKHGHTFWECRCDCGNITFVTSDCLKSENTQSCGCSQFVYDEKEIVKKSEKHRLRATYNNMIRRCYNIKDNSYKYYGGRGISVCDDWRGEHGFKNFFKWAIENGYDRRKTRKEQSLDRINVNGNYEPENCRWADMKTQANNKQI